MSWPIFFKDSLIVGNSKFNVGICTLWSKKENFTKKLKNKFCVIGNLYTAEGISYMLKNILANPVIRYLIICGDDLTKSGEILKKFFEEGIEEDGKIKGTENYIHSNLSKELIDIIRKNVKLIDLRGRENELSEVIEKLGKEEEPFTSPLILPDEKGVEEEINSEIVGFRVEGSLGEVWLKILDLIMKFGEVKESQHSLKQKEIIDVLAIIKSFSLEHFFEINKNILKNYLRSFLSPRKQKGIEYNYGERLFKFSFKFVSEQFKTEMKFFINQIDKIVELLKKAEFTRRAVATIWNPFHDLNSPNPPCLTQINWLIKNRELYQTCIFRSHDIFGAYLLNAIALRKLQKKIARKLGIECGDLIILSHSAHIYENCWKRVERILKSYYRNKPMKFEEDKAGYFRIWIDERKKEIVVQHYLPNGKKSRFKFQGKKASELYKKILNENLITRIDHAAYLGAELARAEICLKEGKKFEQDAA